MSEKLTNTQFDLLVKKKQYARGSYIYLPPDIPGKIFQVNKGVVKIGSYSSNGEEVCFDFVYDNVLFGNLGYHCGSFLEFAKATTDVEIITYDFVIIKHLIAQDPMVYEWFSKSIIERKNRMEQRIISICSLTPKERLIHLFQDFDKIIICNKGKKHWIPDLFSDKEIAQLTGLTRQTVSKILKSLSSFEEENLQYKKSKYCLKDVLH